MADTELGKLPRGIAILLGAVPQRICEDAFGVSVKENFVPRLPERRLPRFRVVMMVLRVVVTLGIIVRLLLIFSPSVMHLHLMLDLLVLTPLAVYAVLFAVWAHARDLREEFHFGQLLIVPQGPAMLAQALFLRPLGAVASLFIGYGLASALSLGLILMGVGLRVGGSFGLLSIMIIFGLFLLLLIGPWIITLIFMFIFTINRGLRGEMIEGSAHVTIAIRALLTIILGVGTLLALIIVTMIMFLPAMITSLALPMFWMSILSGVSLWASRYLYKDWVLPWADDMMWKLGSDLNHAWREG